MLVRGISVTAFSAMLLCGHASAQHTEHHTSRQDDRDTQQYLPEPPTAEQVQGGFKVFLDDAQRMSAEKAAAEARSGKEALKGGGKGGVNKLLPQAEELGSRGCTFDHTLTVKYGDSRLFNPKLGTNVDLHLRSYNGSLVGQTWRVKPGDLLRVLVNNQLPLDQPHAGPLNEPHGFNTTNLHTHGLHVSPAGNSDNVLMSIPPTKSFQNEIYINPKHAAGTFWYHGHVHGSTAIQVTSGMAGALIVEGGLDEAPVVKDATEQIMLFQQVPYVKGTAADGVADRYVVESYANLVRTDGMPVRFPTGGGRPLMASRSPSSAPVPRRSSSGE